MAGIRAIYGLVVSVIIAIRRAVDTALFAGFVPFGAGRSVGLAGLAAGFAIGIVGDAGVRGTAQQPRLYVGMVWYYLHCSTVISLTWPLSPDFDFDFRRGM